jgi:hypothetical protein
MVNEYFAFHDYGYSFLYYIFELSNFLFCFLISLIALKFKWISKNIFFIWQLLFATPFFFNYFLFPPEYFGDQFRYVAEAYNLKVTGESLEPPKRDTLINNLRVSTITLPAQVLGLIPLPAYMTVTSLAFSSKIILFFFYIYIQRLFKDERVIIFFLIPSLLLYSSLALRDIMIIVVTVLYLIAVIKNRILLSVILWAPIGILKFQNALFLLIYPIGKFIFKAHKSSLAFFLFIFGGLILSISIESFLLDGLNLYRIAFAEDDATADTLLLSEAFGLQMQSIFWVYFEMIKNFIPFLFTPLPQYWSNAFYPIQFVENLIILGMFYMIVRRYALFRHREFYLMILPLIIGLGIYSIVIFNEGTAVRYRFSLFVPYLLGLSYLGLQKLKPSQQDK